MASGPNPLRVPVELWYGALLLVGAYLLVGGDFVAFGVFAALTVVALVLRWRGVGRQR